MYTGKVKMTNKLITLNCKPFRFGRKPVYLVGMMEIEDKEDVKEGYILIISGNPIIPCGRGGWYSNKIGIDKLHLTSDQENTILKSCIVPDRNVFLYVGRFIIGKSCHSGNLAWENLNILELLGEYLNYFIVKLDMRRVVPFKEKLINKIIDMRIDSRLCLQPEERNRKVGFTLYNILDKIYVEMECPVTHPEYKTEIFFFETFISEPEAGTNQTRSIITRVLEHVKITVPQTWLSRSQRSNLQQRRKFRYHCNDEKVKLSLITLEMPSYQEPENRGFLTLFRVTRIHYWTIVRLIKVRNDEWNGVTNAMLTVRETLPRRRSKKSHSRKSSKTKRTSSSGRQSEMRGRTSADIDSRILSDNELHALQEVLPGVEPSCGVCTATKSPVAGPSRLAGQSPVAGPSRLAMRSPVAGPSRLASKSPVAGPSRLATKSPVAGPSRLATKSPVSGPSSLATKSPVAGPSRLATKSPVAGPSRSARQLSVGQTSIGEQIPKVQQTSRGTQSHISGSSSSSEDLYANEGDTSEEDQKVFAKRPSSLPISLHPIPVPSFRASSFLQSFPIYEIPVKLVIIEMEILKD